MAELLLKTHTVGPDPLSQDGDIIVACSDRRIKCVHAEHICHFKNFGFDKNGLRPFSLTQLFLEKTRQFKFVRVTPAEILKYNLRTLNPPTLVTLTPNADGDAMDVREYVKRRLQHPKHLMFGTPGHEIWYGGITYVEDADLDLVWADITERVSLHERDHRNWPWSDTEKAHFLAIKTNRLTDLETEAMVEPEREQIGTDELGNPITRIKRKRKQYVHWQGLPALGHSEANVKDPTKIIEARGKSFNKASIVRNKNL